VKAERHSARENAKPPRAALHAECRTPTEKAVLFTIAQLCDWRTGRFDRSIEVLAKAAGVSRRSAQTALARFHARGWITGDPKQDRRKNGVRIYHFALHRQGHQPANLRHRESPKVDRIEEILNWARELGLHPTTADRAVAREWVGRTSSPRPVRPCHPVRPTRSLSAALDRSVGGRR
jgi:hypothetical protein